MALSGRLHLVNIISWRGAQDFFPRYYLMAKAKVNESKGMVDCRLLYFPHFGDCRDMQLEPELSGNAGDSPRPGLGTTTFLESKPAGAMKACHNCGIALYDDEKYFTIGGQLTCEYCSKKVKGKVSKGGASAAPVANRAVESSSAPLVNGIVAAVVAAAGYAIFATAARADLGFLAFGVGWLVGYAVKRGAGGRTTGSMRFKALVLVYLSLVAAHTFIGLEAGDLTLAAVLTLFLTALAHPLAGGVQNVVYLALGLFQAWRASAPVKVKTKRTVGVPVSRRMATE